MPPRSRPEGSSTTGEDASARGAACAARPSGTPESSVAPANTPPFLRTLRRDGSSVMVLHSLTDQEPVAESALRYFDDGKCYGMRGAGVKGRAFGAIRHLANY